MAVFQSEPGEVDPRTIERLPHDSFALSLLILGPVSLYCSRQHFETAVETLRTERFVVHSLDASRWRGRDAAHDALQEAMDFPDYYGRNLDALNDVLSDVPIVDEGGLVLALDRFDEFWRRDPGFSAGLLDVLASASRRLQLFGKSLLVLVRVDDPNSNFGPLGATVAFWNPREFVRSERKP